MGTLAQRQVAHIWRRLGFGAAGSDVDQGVASSPLALIEDLLNRPLTTPADWNFTTGTDYIAQSQFLGRQLALMATGANPLQERLAWILQGLIVVGLDGTVYFPDLRDHILRLRGNPFASYRQLLSDVTTMTGMMKYLNGYQNSAQHPNQNYARELMELFSLGINHPTTGADNYTQIDVVEVARALTGYTLNWNTGTIVFDASQFDSGTKAFLGQSRGDAGVPEVISAISSHPSFPYFVPRRLYRELVGLEPAKTTLDSLATLWGSTGDVHAVVAAIVHLPDFLSDAAIGSKAKTPVELMANAAKVLRFDLSGANYSWQMQDFLGQYPFIPPNVSGWPVGSRWLNAGVAMTWCGMLQDFVAASIAAPGGVVDQLLASTTSASAASTAPAIAAYMCGITDISATTAAALSSYVASGSWTQYQAAGTLALVLLSPEFFIN
jgi:uncharacterized protein (DUF1800 family)